MRWPLLFISLFLSLPAFGDVAQWIRDLKSPTPAIRKAAAEALEKSGNRSDAVIAALHQSLARLPSDKAKDGTAAAYTASFRALMALAPGDDRTIQVFFRVRARPLVVHPDLLDDIYRAEDQIKLQSVDQVEGYLKDGNRIQQAVAATLLAKKGWALRPAAVTLNKLIPYIADGNFILAQEVLDGINAIGPRARFLGDRLRLQLTGLLDHSADRQFNVKLGETMDRFTDLSYGELMLHVAEVIRNIDPDHPANKALFQRLVKDLRITKNPRSAQRALDLVSVESGRPAASQDAHDRVQIQEALRIGLSLPPDRDTAYVTLISVLNRTSSEVRDEVLEEFSRETDMGRQILFVMAAKEHANADLMTRIQQLSWCGPILQAL